MSKIVLGGKSSTALLFAVVLLAGAGGCGRLAPTGPLGEADEILRITAIFSEDVRILAPVRPGSVIEATGTASIKGVFRLRESDRIPAPVLFVLPAAPAVCLPGGKPIVGEALVIDRTTRGIANVVIYLRTKNDSIAWSNVSRPPEVMEVNRDDPANEPILDQIDCEFRPHVLALRVGQAIEVINSDPVPHNVNGIGNVLLAGVSSTTIRPEKQAASPIPIACNIHPWMAAWILPRDNGFFAVTDANGAFEIKNLPAGIPLEFDVWHETSASPSQRLQLDVLRDGVPSLDWSRKRRGRFRITLTPDQTIDLGVIDVPISAFRP
jgi:hypothetical protein